LNLGEVPRDHTPARRVDLDGGDHADTGAAEREAESFDAREQRHGSESCANLPCFGYHLC
jgi:hypothetical protein